MPLTPAKLAHLRATIDRSWQGRTQRVRLTRRTAAGGTATMDLTAIWRPAQDADPSFGPAYGEGGGQLQIADVVAVFRVADIAYQQLRATLYAELVPGEGAGVEPAGRYVLTSIAVRGMQPGGSRYLTYWIRQEP